MKGALRIAVLLFTALKIQRVLLWIGGALLVVGYLLPLPVRGFAVVLGCVLPLVPSTFAGGLLLRFLVAPRGIRLIPHARERVLGGMLLAILTLATVVALVGWSFGLDPGAVWLRTATLGSIVLLTQFMAGASVPGTIGWFLAFFGCVQAVVTPGMRELIRPIAQNEALISAILVIAWIAFSAWFVQVRAFKSPSDKQAYGNRVFKVDPSHATAIRTFLIGSPSGFYLYSGGLTAALSVMVVWTLFSLFAGASSSFADALSKGLVPALAIGAFAGFGGFLVVRRSKFLWLRGAVDRRGLFRLCERQAWRFYGATTVSVVALQILLSLLNPALMAKYFQLLLFHLSAGVCVLYLGLMHVRGWRPLDILCAIGLALALGVGSGMLASIVPLHSLVLLVYAVMAGVAIAFRLTALHRWRTIDWLVCKPPRVPARGAQEVRWT